MKKYLFLSFLLVFSGVLSLATPLGLTKVGYPGGKTYLYRLYLKDKCHSFYSLSHPEAYLSQRSLERRQRQHLAIDSTDLPVSPDYIAALRGCGIEIVGKSKWNNTVFDQDSFAERSEGSGGTSFYPEREEGLYLSGLSYLTCPLRISERIQ
jgi:hypothetical protein